MKLRNGKRKMFFSENLLKRKKAKQELALPKLHVNDENTHPAEYTKLWNVGPKRARKIFQEKSFRGNFVSEKDLIDRVQGFTPQTIYNSNVQLVFKAWRNTTEIDIYNTLLEIKWIQNEKNVLKLIAEHSVGTVVECDKENCQNTIVMLDHAALYNRTPLSMLYEKACYVFREYDEKHWYYYRNNPLIGTIIYCGECYLQLRNCPNCFEHTYFDNDDSTYTICPKQHMVQERWTGHRHQIQFKYCLSCYNCYDHASHNEVITQFCCHFECFADAYDCDAISEWT